MTNLKIKMHTKTDNDYVQVLPETVASQVIDEVSGQTIGKLIHEALKPISLVTQNYTVTASAANQKNFTFQRNGYDHGKSVSTVHVNGEFMHPSAEYSIDNSGSNPIVVLQTGVPSGTKVHITIITAVRV